MRLNFITKEGALLCQFRLGHGHITAGILTGHNTFRSIVAQTVLNGFDLHVVPIFPERRQDAPVMGHVPIPVGRPFPNAQGRQMGRLLGRDMPLIDPVIGNAVETDLAV